MPTLSHGKNSSAPSPSQMDEVSPNYQGLEFRDWDHGGTEETDDPHLPLIHTATLLPSVLEHVLEKRNALMNPHRFHL